MFSVVTPTDFTMAKFPTDPAAAEFHRYRTHQSDWTGPWDYTSNNPNLRDWRPGYPKIKSLQSPKPAANKPGNRCRNRIEIGLLRLLHTHIFRNKNILEQWCQRTDTKPSMLSKAGTIGDNIQFVFFVENIANLCGFLQQIGVLAQLFHIITDSSAPGSSEQPNCSHNCSNRRRSRYGRSISPQLNRSHRAALI